MTQGALKIIELSNKAICPICHADLLKDTPVINYFEFKGVQVGVCGRHPTPCKN